MKNLGVLFFAGWGLLISCSPRTGPENLSAWTIKMVHPADSSYFLHVFDLEVVDEGILVLGMVVDTGLTGREGFLGLLDFSGAWTWFWSWSFYMYDYTGLKILNDQTIALIGGNAIQLRDLSGKVIRNVSAPCRCGIHDVVEENGWIYATGVENVSLNIYSLAVWGFAPSSPTPAWHVSWLPPGDSVASGALLFPRNDTLCILGRTDVPGSLSMLWMSKNGELWRDTVLNLPPPAPGHGVGLSQGVAYLSGYVEGFVEGSEGWMVFVGWDGTPQKSVRLRGLASFGGDPSGRGISVQVNRANDTIVMVGSVWDLQAREVVRVVDLGQLPWQGVIYAFPYIVRAGPMGYVLNVNSVHTLAFTPWDAAFPGIGN